MGVAFTPSQDRDETLIRHDTARNGAPTALAHGPSGGRGGERAASDPLAAEATLIRALKCGEAEAFEILVRDHGPRMMLVIRRFLPRECDAEDALQDAFMNVFRSIADFAAESRLATWLHRVAANAALMRIRSRSRRPETLVAESSLDGTACDTSERAHSRHQPTTPTGAEAQDLVRRSLDRLDADARTVIQLRDLHGMALPEICRLLDVGMSTVKSRLRRGRISLRIALQSTTETVTS